MMQGGCIDTAHQSLALLLMALTPEDVSRIRTGPLSPHTIQCLRHYRDIFGVTFKVRADRAKADLAADLERQKQAESAAAEAAAAADSKDDAEMDDAEDEGADGAEEDEPNDKGTRRVSKKQRRLAEKAAKREAAAAKKNVDVSAAASQSAYTIVLSCLGIGFKNINRKTA